MKWRYSPSVHTFLLVAVLFVSADCSSSGNKASLENAKAEIEEKISPSIGDEASDDDLLARTKKSSTTTTFCVEIKPGNEQPAVVVCDPSKTDQQVPIPNKPAPHHPEPAAPYHPEPTPHYEHPNFPIPSNIPNYLPEYPRGLVPESSYEPLIFIPQQPQIIQPQIIQPFSAPQPQIILVRDPSCPSNNPLIVSNPYGAGLYSRSSQYGMMEPTNYLGNGYNGEGDMMRSIPASGLGGLVNNGYTSPLDLIYSRRGQNPPTNTVTLSPIGGPALVNSNQHFDGQYNRPVLIQCNPKVIPLSQDAYAAATSGKANANEQGFKTNVGTMQGSSAAGHQTQFMYQPGGGGFHGGHQTHESLNHQPLQHNINQHHHSNSYPYNSGNYKMMPEFGAGGRAAEETGEAVKTVKEMSMQQGQMTPVESFAKILPSQKVQAGEGQHNSQSIFNGQGNHQGVSGGDGRILSNQEQQQQQQQKMEVGKLIEGNQNSQSRFPSSSFVQGQTGFVNGDRMLPKDQGLQKQMGFSQNQNQNHQQQQQITPNGPRTPGIEQKNSQQSGGSNMSSYSQMLLQRMKSQVGQGNLVQPYMVSAPGLAGDKQTQLKVQN